MAKPTGIPSTKEPVKPHGAGARVVSHGKRIALLAEFLRTGLFNGPAKLLGISKHNAETIRYQSTPAMWEEARHYLKEVLKEEVLGEIHTAHARLHRLIDFLAKRAEEVGAGCEDASKLARLIESVTDAYKVIGGTPSPADATEVPSVEDVKKLSLQQLAAAIRRGEMKALEVGLEYGGVVARGSGAHGATSLFDRMSASGMTQHELEEEQAEFLGRKVAS